LITIIVAMTRDGIIGKGGSLPWRLPEDMRHFRRTTMGNAVVMGRKTFESIGKALVGRETIVVSRTLPERDDVVVCRTMEEALAEGRRGGREVFVAGGAEIYRQTLATADRLLVSHVHGEYEGDATFPEVDPEVWRVTSRDHYADFELVDYQRREEGTAT
jgi:dihydrofolate reductase